ncbi:MAG: hypoxanthine phosphoribosyltransferase [Acidobacteriota bacterium]
MADQNPNSSPRVLISRERLEARVAEMSAEIERDYLRRAEELGEGSAPQPLLCIGVLKGSVFFMVDLLKEIETLPVKVDFFQTSSYRDGTSPGEVRILKDVDLAIRDRDVLLIEDIVDTGFTLSTILALLKHRGARSVRLCALLDKREARKVNVPIDYCGFEIEDLFVVGYGLDLADRYRNLPYIGVYEEDF